MCLLTVALPGSTQRIEDLKIACINNPDGFGYAVHAGKRIITGRGMDAETLIARYLADRARFPEGPAMFHARFATHGTESLDNCHPFRVGGDREIVLAHNGILPMTVARKERRSDTRIYAEEVLPRLGVSSLDDPAWVTATEKWLGGNKIAILSTSPHLSEPIYLLNEELGAWTDDIWWSNDTYRDLPPYGQWPPFDGDDLGEACEMCGTVLSRESILDGFCAFCECCLWCSAEIDDCLCYQPEEGASSRAELFGVASGHQADIPT